MILIESDESDASESTGNLCTHIKKVTCNNCLRCCYILLRKHNMYSKACVMLYKSLQNDINF